MKNKISDLPLIAVSYLQKLANGNPRMVQSASMHFQDLRAQFDNHQISQAHYLKLIEKYIDDQQTA
ncbi:hypothetical protein FACS1894166_08750 [Bacilli bacterium]|nr:hypothetical protein FACS1894166_08750 [Bacilli bacterium]